MPTEITARADQQSDAPDEGDYQAFCEALSASARGRAFLAEYTRRNRNADTEQLLAAIERLQSLVTSNAATPPSATVKQELHALLDEIDAAQREFEASVLAIKAGKLAGLIALVERRISKILASPREETLKIAAPVAPVIARELPHEPDKEVERSHLAVVPLPEQPELPIPSPAAAQPPSIALVRTETVMAEITFVEPPPAPLPQPSSEPGISTAREGSRAARTAAAPADPLASIMALSEEERLALFT
jgi:hypothetical protein